MSSVLDKYAKSSVPRYTSYPTAPHFKPDLSESVYRGWLAQLDADEPISLYLHVPFCKQMCWYCGCNMKLASKYSPVADYVEKLIAEIDLIADAMPARMPVGHLHFGGGTPTVLEPDDLGAVMALLGERFRFIPGAELAIESDPRTLSDEMVDKIGQLGFTRASFGVQEFDPKVQAAINRIQPPDMVAHALKRFRAVGVTRVNFDLIYGLPYQTAQDLRRTVEQCVEMRPDRVALFGYAHVPWVAKNQRMIPDESLPKPEQRAEQADAAAEALVKGGYVRLGLDHFALPGDSLAIAATTGRLHRNFQGYTSDAARTLIGIGSTSIGRTPLGYVQNISETGAWSRAVTAGKLPIARGHAMNGQDDLRAHVIERLMCDGKVDLVAAGRAHGDSDDWYAPEQDALDELQRDGLLVRNGGQVTLTADGARLSRVVASVFDTYLRNSSVRHSIAV
ncbi:MULTISPECIES: oxygen-independent coproporphyrinogen III oxidase [Rhodopseudomonas]|uniref:Coproporphyrinogen-III oxidase n=1 Tax=Rhodopseudomonas palustris TaxID=1076 RepID=A0A0D7EKV9_RHOPL|nr:MULTISPECIES: oxygen-independent coproporphyrinogen III oxidase [Rhodopseudomonas]KIZ40102.1 coproporphyrinogen III oxidase [Rhodopseudomonas palustris]MDF3811691.1 oxygen-independent coproporphyrinogen III oxidase [Rhodopseudomonas sp. BAL398]WOK17920.1 oxygen-independent coproporphyrinogen III oxidase [Rhodopseudomonas sp. BAL398]